MKKYFFEADRKQWEKPTEPKYLFCATAKTWAIAETEEEARAVALDNLRNKYHASGILVDDCHLRLTKAVELPNDWNYGYGEGRGTGSVEDRAVLIRENTT